MAFDQKAGDVEHTGYEMEKHGGKQRTGTGFFC